MAIIIFIFTILLILIFIEIYKGRIISHGRREYILGVATEEAIVEWEKEYGMSRDVFTKEEGR